MIVGQQMVWDAADLQFAAVVGLAAVVEGLAAAVVDLALPSHHGLRQEWLLLLQQFAG